MCFFDSCSKQHSAYSVIRVRYSIIYKWPENFLPDFFFFFFFRNSFHQLFIKTTFKWPVFWSLNGVGSKNLPKPHVHDFILKLKRHVAPKKGTWGRLNPVHTDPKWTWTKLDPAKHEIQFWSLVLGTKRTFGKPQGREVKQVIHWSESWTELHQDAKPQNEMSRYTLDGPEARHGNQNLLKIQVLFYLNVINELESIIRTGTRNKKSHPSQRSRVCGSTPRRPSL